MVDEPWKGPETAGRVVDEPAEGGATWTARSIH